MLMEVHANGEEDTPERRGHLVGEGSGSNGGKGCRAVESVLTIDGEEKGARLVVEQGHDGGGVTEGREERAAA